jgi:hypothetical protein
MKHEAGDHFHVVRLFNDKLQEFHRQLFNKAGGASEKSWQSPAIAVAARLTAIQRSMKQTCGMP